MEGPVSSRVIAEVVRQIAAVDAKPIDIFAHDALSTTIARTRIDDQVLEAVECCFREFADYLGNFKTTDIADLGKKLGEIGKKILDNNGHAKLLEFLTALSNFGERLACLQFGKRLGGALDSSLPLVTTGLHGDCVFAVLRIRNGSEPERMQLWNLTQGRKIDRSPGETASFVRNSPYLESRDSSRSWLVDCRTGHTSELGFRPTPHAVFYSFGETNLLYCRNEPRYQAIDLETSRLVWQEALSQTPVYLLHNGSRLVGLSLQNNSSVIMDLKSRLPIASFIKPLVGLFSGANNSIFATLLQSESAEGDSSVCSLVRQDGTACGPTRFVQCRGIGQQQDQDYGLFITKQSCKTDDLPTFEVWNLTTNVVLEKFEADRAQILQIEGRICIVACDRQNTVVRQVAGGSGSQLDETKHLPGIMPRVAMPLGNFQLQETRNATGRSIHRTDTWSTVGPVGCSLAFDKGASLSGQVGTFVCLEAKDGRFYNGWDVDTNRATCETPQSGPATLIEHVDEKGRMPLD